MRTVLVLALKSFDGFTEGQQYWVEMTPAVAHLIVVYYLKLMWDPTWEV